MRFTSHQAGASNFFKNGLSVTLPVIALFAAGCASQRGEFSTKKDSNYTKRMEAVLVVYHVRDLPGQLGGDYGPNIAKSLRTMLQGRGIRSEDCVISDKDNLKETKRLLTQHNLQNVLHLVVRKVDQINRSMVPPPSMAFSSRAEPIRSTHTRPRI